MWDHWTEHRYPLPEDRDEKGLLKGFRRVSDSWSLENAFETREQCISRIQKRLDRIREVRTWAEQDSKPNERSRFKLIPVAQEINREMYIFQDLQKADGTQERSSAVIKVWCLPVGVDPKSIGDR